MKGQINSLRFFVKYWGKSIDMTTYQVQFVMPVDNPVSNVRMARKKGAMVFEVPINHPDAHKMGLMDLIAAAELSGLITVSTTLNKNRVDSKKRDSITAQ